jgi:hypothetical protein
MPLDQEQGPCLLLVFPLKKQGLFKDFLDDQIPGPPKDRVAMCLEDMYIDKSTNEPGCDSVLLFALGYIQERKVVVFFWGGGASRSQSDPHMHVLVCICSNVRQFNELHKIHSCVRPHLDFHLWPVLSTLVCLHGTVQVERPKRSYLHRFILLSLALPGQMSEFRCVLVGRV